MVTMTVMLIPLSALAAFRQDLASRPDGATAADSRWLQVVTLLQSATDVPAPARRGILDVAADLADPDAAAPDGTPLPFPLTIRATLPPVVELALRAASAMEDAARFQLAYATYDAVLRLIVAELADERARAEVQGVVLCLQGRVARQLGDSAVAAQHYRDAERVGRAGRLRGVEARAWVGLGLLAQVRGNHPEARRWFTQVLGVSEAPVESRQVAHQALMVSASAAGDFETAALHGWAAYELAPNEVDSTAALCDLAELLRVAGHPALALRGFCAALTRTPGARVGAARQLLPALGGASLAAAQALRPEPARRLVDSFARQIATLVQETQIPFTHGVALADLADAYACIGDAQAAEGYRATARNIARQYSFFELLYRVTEGAVTVNATPAAVVPTPMPSAQSVLAAVRSFGAPADVEAVLAAAGA